MTGYERLSQAIQAIVGEEAPPIPQQQLLHFMSFLLPRERDILNLRFGLDGDRSRTLAEVGKEFGVTQTRIGQIEAKALRKIRGHRHQTEALADTT